MTLSINRSGRIFVNGTTLGRSTGFPLVGSTPRSGSSSRSLSARPSFGQVQEDELTPLAPRQSSRTPSGPSRPNSHTPPPSTRRRLSSRDHSRGSSRSRFNLPSVSNLFDAMRPKSVARPEDSERSDDGRTGRGRAQEKSKATEHDDGSLIRASRERSTLGKLGDIFKLESDVADVGDGWKEFKKGNSPKGVFSSLTHHINFTGTYTYPISFEIPANAPATLQCPYGTVDWRLYATVHRPGHFTSKWMATHEVIVISSPREEENEETRNIVIERHWEQQLQYLISISGHRFFIGGTIPITISFMPLSKIKIHRFSVHIEGMSHPFSGVYVLRNIYRSERIDYYTQMRRVARSDPVTFTELLSIKKQPGSTPPHILPLESDDADILRGSPLSALLTTEDDLSEIASHLMGPGPWTFHHELKLPTSCSLMHFTNENRTSNIVITHFLRWTIRVEHGNLDPKTGKGKFHDIVIQNPIVILSVSCCS